MTEAPVVVPSQVPSHWYNLAADLPEPCPPALHPGTKEPLGPDDLGADRDRAGHAGGRSGHHRVAGHGHLRGGRGRGDRPERHCSLGIVLNHVLLHQSVIGVEALAAYHEFV